MKMKLTDNASKRNLTSIELCRIIGCLIVISLHSLSTIGTGNKQYLTLLKAFLENGVPIFFMIMGFFLFCSSKSYFEKLRSLLYKTVIPVSIVLMLTYAVDLLLHRSDVGVPTIIKEIVYTLMTGDILNNEALHLWYMFTYIKITLWLPLLKMICPVDTQSTSYEHACKIRRTIIVSFVVLTLFSDIMYLFPDAVCVGGGYRRIA